MAAADLNDIRNTIEGTLVIEMDFEPVIPIVFNNMAYEPAPNSSWIQCLTAFGANEYLGHGLTTSGYNRITGLTLFNIFTPKGAGPGANLIIGKRIRDLYNRTIVSGVFFDAPIGPEALGSPSPEGYYQTQVRVAFEFIEEL